MGSNPTPGTEGSVSGARVEQSCSVDASKGSAASVSKLRKRRIAGSVGADAGLACQQDKAELHEE